MAIAVAENNVNIAEMETVVFTCACADPANIHPNSPCPYGTVKRASRLENYWHRERQWRVLFAIAKWFRDIADRRPGRIGSVECAAIADAIIECLPRITSSGDVTQPQIGKVIADNLPRIEPVGVVSSQTQTVG